jgi:hypothetical protein
MPKVHGFYATKPPPFETNYFLSHAPKSRLFVLFWQKPKKPRGFYAENSNRENGHRTINYFAQLFRRFFIVQTPNYFAQLFRPNSQGFFNHVRSRYSV